MSFVITPCKYFVESGPRNEISLRDLRRAIPFLDSAEGVCEEDKAGDEEYLRSGGSGEISLHLEQTFHTCSPVGTGIGRLDKKFVMAFMVV